MAEADASANADGAQTGVDQASSAQRDLNSVSGRVADFDKDTGADERIESFGATQTEMNFLNAKRTYDLHQSLDTDAMIYARKHQSKLDSMEIQAAEQRLVHQAKMNSQEIFERETARRHYEDNHTVRIMALGGFMNDAVTESFADNVAKKVVDRLTVSSGE